LTVAHDGTSSSSATTTEQLPSNTPLVTPAAVAALQGTGSLAATTSSNSDDANASERDLREERLHQQQQQRSSSGGGSGSGSGSRGSLDPVPEQSEAVREDVHAGLDYGLKHGGSPTAG
jgi:hypothetical protein